MMNQNKQPESSKPASTSECEEQQNHCCRKSARYIDTFTTGVPLITIHR